MNGSTQGTQGAPETETEQPEMVDVHEADIASLDAAIAAEQEKEKAESASLEDPKTDPAPTQTQQPSGQPGGAPQQPMAQQPVGQSPAPTQTGVATQGAQPSTSGQKYTPEQVQAIVAEHERRSNGGIQKESFVQNRRNELTQVTQQIANNRTQLMTLRDQLANGLSDRWQENPQQASLDQQRIQELDGQIGQLDAYESRVTGVVEAQTLFVQNVDTENVTPNDMAQVLRAEGLGEQYVAQFLANPWEFMSPDALVRLGRHAIAMKEHEEAKSQRALLAKHVLWADAEIKRLKNRSQHVMGEVQRRLDAGPSVTAGSGQSARGAQAFDPSTIERMSNADLDAAIRAAQAQERMH